MVFLQFENAGVLQRFDVIQIFVDVFLGFGKEVTLFDAFTGTLIEGFQNGFEALEFRIGNRVDGTPRQGIFQDRFTNVPDIVDGRKDDVGFDPLVLGGTS